MSGSATKAVRDFVPVRTLRDMTLSLPHFLQRKIATYVHDMRQEEFLRQLKMVLEHKPDYTENNEPDPQSPIEYNIVFGLRKIPFQGIGDEQKRVFFVSGDPTIIFRSFDEATSFQIQVFPKPILYEGSQCLDQYTVEFSEKQNTFWNELKQRNSFLNDKITTWYDAKRQETTVYMRKEGLLELLRLFPGTAFLLYRSVAIVAKPF